MPRRPPRRLASFALASLALASLALAGCASLGAAGRAYDEAWAPLEGVPPKARALQALPLPQVLGALSGWDWFELGRRFEHGVGGAPRDLDCAAVFYGYAAAAPYLDEDELHGFPTSTRRIGLPLARVRLRHLPPLEGARLFGARQRCGALLQAAG